MDNYLPVQYDEASGPIAHRYAEPHHPSVTRTVCGLHINDVQSADWFDGDYCEECEEGANHERI